MPETEDRRSQITDSLADFILAEGLNASSLRPLAKAAGLSDRMLLYHFKDKSEVITAALTRIAERVAVILEHSAPPTALDADALRAFLWPRLSQDQMWPYMQIWLETASLAARGDVVCRTVGEAIGRGFVEWVKSHLVSNQPDIDAAKVLTSIEGMVLLKSLGLGDVSEQAV